MLSVKKSKVKPLTQREKNKNREETNVYWKKQTEHEFKEWFTDLDEKERIEYISNYLKEQYEKILEKK
jgi:hypothetical protein